MEMSVGRKYTETWLVIFDLPGDKSKIGHHLLEVVDDIIGTIIRDMLHK